MAAQRNPNVGNAVHPQSGTVVHDSNALVVAPIDGVLQYSLTGGYTVNIGDFNNKRAEGMVAGKFSADIPVDDVVEYLDERLYALIREELLIAKKLAPAKSYVHDIPID